MCLSVWSRSSACATLGSYSISACSCVKLTATLSTPGRRPSACSIVPVHNEQCSPPIRARMRRRPGRLEGSSLQRRGADSTVVAVLIGHLCWLQQREEHAHVVAAYEEQRDSAHGLDTSAPRAQPREPRHGPCEQPDQQERQALAHRESEGQGH